jgi:phage tail tape-measure protein
MRSTTLTLTRAALASLACVTLSGCIGLALGTAGAVVGGAVGVAGAVVGGAVDLVTTSEEEQLKKDVEAMKKEKKKETGKGD